MVKRSPLDDALTRKHAWARYRRVMRWMAVVAFAIVIVALTLVYRETGIVSVHLFVATALGVGLTMLLMATLMGLVFLSSGTGHDESVSEFVDHEEDGRRR